jgi:predicted nucleotidyltransferase
MRDIYERHTSRSLSAKENNFSGNCVIITTQERRIERGALMETTIKTKQDVWKILHQNRDRLKALGVSRIGLFGSFVRGEQHPDSDIDLLVEFEAGQKTFDAFMDLSFLLAGC